VTQPDDRVAVIATTALTDNERWIAIPAGNLLAFKDGMPVVLGETQTVAQDFPRASSNA
jgi:glutamine amidotransferase